MMVEHRELLLVKAQVEFGGAGVACAVRPEAPRPLRFGQSNRLIEILECFGRDRDVAQRRYVEFVLGEPHQREAPELQTVRARMTSSPAAGTG